MPESFRAAEVAGDYRPAAWWMAFEDPVLNELVDGALAANLDIAQAAARAERAAAQARVSRAGLSPSLDASAGASYSDTPLSGGAFSNFPFAPTRLSNESYSLGMAASYELDLFGRVRDDYRAARSDALAAEQDYRSSRLATVGEVISAYFDTVDARYQIENTRRTLDVLRDRDARTEERYRRGLAQSFELYQIRQELRGTEANLPQRETALASAEGRLALLLAEYPAGLDEMLAGPLQPRLTFAPVPSGMPADLLTQRPDVAAAWERLEAARLRIGARRAERFPRLSLSASTGTQGGEVGDVLDFGTNWLLQLGANMVAPIIDGGRINANIRAARASYDETAAAYGKAVLNAWREVELASVEYEQQRTRYSLIHAQLNEAAANADVQAERYRAGVADYTAYLDALRAQYQVESSLSAAGRDVALARLGLHRALGGDWEDEGTMQ